MRLIAAPGDGRVQRAIANSYVHIIVDILLDTSDRELLTLVARLLKKYTQRAQTGLEEALRSIRKNQRHFTQEGYTIPAHILALTDAIHQLYQQSESEIRFLRGAIVELLAFELVHPRYRPGECLSNQRFLDAQGRTVTDQVDVAALSHERHELEGYECKIKVDGIESSDCTSLSYLFDVSQNWDFRASVGIVTFDEDLQMKRKLERLNPASCIHLYGLDSVFTLQYTPFAS